MTQGMPSIREKTKKHQNSCIFHPNILEQILTIFDNHSRMVQFTGHLIPLSLSIY